MFLNFNETCIVNQTLDVNNKGEYINKLIELRENSSEDELHRDIDSLIDKVMSLSKEDFEQLVRDRNMNKIYTFPVYYL